MKAEFVKKEGNQVSFKMTVDKTEFESAVQKAYIKTRGRFNIPGFRKGKTPRQVIETNYGVGVFYEEAINVLLPEHYPTVVDELAIDPVDRPDFDIESIDKEEGVVITGEVTVKPEVKLGAYNGVEVEKVEYTVSDEDVDAELGKTQEQNARVVNVEDRPVQDGDTALIDYKGFVGEEQFEGGTGNDHDLVIGSNSFIPGFEEQLIGVELNAEVDVNVTFPEQYHSEDLAGKDAVFKVTVKGIKAKELPTLDDEFAQETSEFDTLEALKADTRAKLEEGAKTRTENEQRDKVVDVVAEGVEVEIPDAMVDTELETMLRDFDQQLRYQGLDLEKYLQFTGMAIDALKDQMREDAGKRVKTNLTIDAIKKAESIEATDADLEAEYEKIAEIQKQPIEDIKKMFGRDNGAFLKDTILARKAVEFLVENAKLV